MDSFIQHRFVEPLAALPMSVRIVAAAILLIVVYSRINVDKAAPGIPIVSVKEKGFTWSMLAFNSWMRNARMHLEKGSKECASCFQVLTGTGYKIVVPNRFANEIRNNSDLNFLEAGIKDFFVEYPGFDGHRQGLKDGAFMLDVVRIKLTQSLGLVNADLVEEANDSIRDTLGSFDDWETRDVKEDMLEVVARLTSRVFLGKEICRNKEWIQISKKYTIDGFVAAFELRMIFAPLRPIMQWIMPTCTRLRREVRDARRIIEPEFQKKVVRAETTIKAGGKPDKVADAIGWIVEAARGQNVDYTAAQLAMSMVAIHTTSETTAISILQLCESPELVEPLRQEAIKVLNEDGWNKSSLYKLRLMDSFLKECQRMHGLSMCGMHRIARKDVTLSDGTVIPKGYTIMVSNTRTKDEEFFPDSRRFDAQRFLRLRQQPGEENRHQFVTPTPDILSFGLGEHACPGRFFAANEIKITLCFLLLRYDFRFPPSQPKKPADMEIETAMILHPSVRVQMRSREPELDLENPQGSLST